jgi:hypothetical protein
VLVQVGTMVTVNDERRRHGSSMTRVIWSCLFDVQQGHAFDLALQVVMRASLVT